MQTIAHYNILERLGTGALGDVYRARDLKVGRTVALMMVPSDIINPATGTSRRETFLAQADRVVVLVEGRVAAIGAWSELSGHWGHLAG